MKPKRHDLRHGDGTFKSKATDRRQKQVGGVMRSKSGQLTRVRKGSWVPVRGRFWWAAPAQEGHLVFSASL